MMYVREKIKRCVRDVVNEMHLKSSSVTTMPSLNYLVLCNPDYLPRLHGLSDLLMIVRFGALLSPGFNFSIRTMRRLKPEAFFC
jgi:hypothetical protein